MSIKIEKGIPMTGLARAFGESRYPFRDMEVGDSFRIPDGEHRNARNAAYLHGIRNNCKFSCRRVGADGYRIWRTA
jgi:hypothetical protein